MLAAAQVRSQVAALLVPCALTAGRVFAGRYYPVGESEMPCWFVAIDQEDIEPEGISRPRLETHRLRLIVEGFVADVETLETSLDTLQTQAMQALFTNPPAYELSCVGVRRRAADTEGHGGRIGVLTLYLEATYLTQEGQPETIFS